MKELDRIKQEIRAGKLAIKNDGTVEQLNQILELCWPGCVQTSGYYDHYFKSVRSHIWDSCNGTVMATIKVTELVQLIEEKPVPQLLPSEKQRFCGCRSGEECNADCIVPKWVAERILKARDAHIAGDFDEVWHQLYSIASPEFDQLKPWETLECIVDDNSKPRHLAQSDQEENIKKIIFMVETVAPQFLHESIKQSFTITRKPQ